MKNLDLFATRIWYENIDNLAPFHKEWVETIKNIRTNKNDNKNYSVKNGWQGDLDFNEIESLAILKQKLLPLFKDILKEIAPQKNINFNIKAWANIQDQIGYNEPHVHPFSLFSAVYYLKVSDKSGSICFKDPRPGLQNHIFASSSNPPPPNNFSSIKIKPKEGLLLIFPSWLEHFTEVNYDSTERISIAMNIDLIL